MGSKKATQDPLVAAVIARLPAQGQPFTRESRVSWLKMMALTFENVYGPVPTIAVDHAVPMQLEHVSGGQPDGHQVVSLDAMREVAAPAPGEGFKKLQRYTVFIDQDGLAKHVNGERIMPSQVGGEVLYDLRGELGDLSAITWADGSMGTRGLQLEISAAEAA